MAGGTWWRDGASEADGGGESVYVPPQAAASPPPFDGGAATEFMKPVSDGPSDDQRKAFESSATRGGRTDVTRAYPGWDTVYFDFRGDEPAAPLPPAPEQAPASAAPAEEGGTGSEDQAAASAAAAAAGAVGLLAGRRPAPLLLVAAVGLLAGAVTGSMLAMLAGWGAAYLSRGLTDFTKKFVVLGIPMVTMTAATVWYWGRAQGRWGSPLAAGGQFGGATWTAAPGVLRVAAVLSALFVLVVTLRRPRA